MLDVTVSDMQEIYLCFHQLFSSDESVFKMKLKEMHIKKLNRMTLLQTCYMF